MRRGDWLREGGWEVRYLAKQKDGSDWDNEVRQG